MHPYVLLKKIAEHSRTNALAIPQQLEAVNYWRGVGFMLGGQQLIVDMNQVSEILQPPRLTKVPGVRSWVLGIANVRGRLVPVMDLNGLLGIPSSASWRSRRVLVVEHGEHFSGLLVDAVLGMQQFSLEEQKEVSGLDPAIAKLCPTGFEKDGSIWPIFKLQELAQAPEFLQVAV